MHRLEATKELESEEKIERSFLYRAPWYSYVMLIVFIIGISTLASYLLYTQNKISLELSSLIFIISMGFSFLIWIKQRKVSFIHVYEDKIKVPKGKGSIIIKFEDIFSVTEQLLNGQPTIRIQRKEASAILLPAINMESKEFYDLLELLESKIPKGTEETAYLKRSKLIARSILFILPTAVIGYLFYKNGATKETITKLSSLLTVALISGLASYVIGKISDYQKKERKRLEHPILKRKRKILNIVMVTFFIITVGGSLLLLIFYHPGKKINFYMDSSPIYLSLSLSMTFYFILDYSLKLAEFVSTCERGLYLVCVLLFGSLSFMVTIPTVTYRQYAETARSSVVKMKLVSTNGDKKCFIPDLDIIMPPQFCTSNYPGISENQDVFYSKIMSPIGITLYENFSIKEGVLTTASVRSKLFENVQAYKQCLKFDEKGLKPEVQVRLNFSIGKDGSVVKSAAITNPPQASSVENCFNNVTLNIKFLKPLQEGTVEISQIINFHPKK